MVEVHKVIKAPAKNETKCNFSTKSFDWFRFWTKQWGPFRPSHRTKTDRKTMCFMWISIFFLFFWGVNLVLDYACTCSQSQHVLSDSIETIDSLHFRLSAIFSLLVAHYSWYSGPIWLLWRWLSNLFHKAKLTTFWRSISKKDHLQAFFFFFSSSPPRTYSR